VAWLEKLESNNRPIRYGCQDETRLGLKTIERKQITACGVKPLGKVQWEFVAYYLYGIVEPREESVTVMILGKGHQMRTSLITD